MKTRSGLIAACLIAAVLAVAGCASSGGSGSGSGSGSSSDTADDSTKPTAAWLNNGASIALVTWGSSSLACIPAASDVKASGQTVTVTLATPPANTVCTMDFVPRGTYVAVPQGVVPTKDATVKYQGDNLDGSIALGGNSALTGQPAEGTSSASWYSPGGIVLLTWGSSSCPPVVQNIAEQANGATVTFQSDAAKACTADFSPRLTMIDVTPPASHAGYALQLIGDGLDGQIAVIG